MSLNTFEELAQKANEMELAGCNFLAKDGTIARKRRHCVRVEFKFIDGVTLTLPKSETDRPGFDALNFKLRPKLNDS